jgi:redox-sensitive bicupin YhaK (pirin superfamily)
MAGLQYSSIVKLREARGENFSAYQARYHAFGDLMSPVLGFDHFRLSKDVFGAQTPEPVTLLDLELEQGYTTDYFLPAGWNGTVYLLSGTLTLSAEAISHTLNSNETIAFGSATIQEKITFTAKDNSHFLLISGPPVVH